MDLIEEVRRRAAVLEGLDVSRGVRAVVQHIEAASKHLKRGRDEGEEEFFNDVVYRTNQAFEGALKEAYRVVTSSDQERLTPYEVEQHLLENRLLPARVVALLTNYRQQWRNPATHDHTLVFSEQEALLAIVSVSAFVSILIDQIVEKLSYAKEQELVGRRRVEVREEMPDYGRQPLRTQLMLLLERFAAENAVGEMQEAELVGRVAGYIQAIDPQIELDSEATVSVAQGLRPDLVCAKGTETVVVEIKHAGVTPSAIRIGQWQLLKYVRLGDFDRGLLFIAPEDPTVRLERVETRNVSTDGEAWIDILAPKRLLDDSAS